MHRSAISNLMSNSTCRSQVSWKIHCRGLSSGYRTSHVRTSHGVQPPSLKRQKIVTKVSYADLTESSHFTTSSTNRHRESRDEDPSSRGRGISANAHAAALCRVLGLPQTRLMAMVARCPSLFAFSPEALDATVMAIASLTGLQTYQVPQLLVVDPELLLQPDRLKTNMRGIAQALGVPVSEVASMATREPSVLALSGAQTEARIGALLDLLLAAGRYEQLVAAVLQNPGALLVPETETVRAQLTDLEAALSRVITVAVADAPSASPSGDAAARPTAVAGESTWRSTGGLPAGPSALQPPSSAAAVGGCCSGEQWPSSPLPPLPGSPAAPPSAGPGAGTQSDPGCAGGGGGAAAAAGGPLRGLVAPLVIAKPSLLGTPPDLLAGRVAHLATRAGVSPTRVLSAAASGPNLLAASSCHIDRHCAALATALPTAVSGADEAAALLVAAPALLSQTAGALGAKWLLLTGVLGSHLRWAAWLAAAPPAERGELLALPYTTVARLRFLADNGTQADAHPLEVVRASDAAFHVQYPGFREWLRS